jgi:putative ABC transport system permease protein
MYSHLAQDLRFAVRSFLRAPRFTVPAVLALALGIGATSAIFSVVQGVILRPLPYRDPERIVVVWEHNLRRNRPRNVIGAANFVAWRERNRSFEHLGMTGPARLNVALDGQPEEVPGLFVSADVFRALGVGARLGRVYTPDEDIEGKDGVIVLSHEFWQSRLGGRGDILNSVMIANGRPRTVVGIMPPGFSVIGQRADFLIPYGWTVERLRQSPGRGSSHGLARLRDGVSFEQAEAEMKAIAAQLEQEAPQRNTGWSVTLVPVHEQMVDQIRPALYVLSGAVLLVLLVACVNVANLLLARSSVRQRELGLRTALGAPRRRLMWQMITESVLLALAGGGAGLALAVAFHRGLLALVADRIPVPRLEQVTVDWTVIAFTMLLALGTGLLFGLVPALLATNNANDVLREGGRGGTSPRARRALGTLVVAEVALSLVLLTGAGLLIRSFINLQNISPGFRTDGILTARVQLPGARYPEATDSIRFFKDAVGRIASLPGVQSAAGVTFMPLTGLGIGTSYWRLDQPVPGAGEAPSGQVRPVTPDFFRTLAIPQLAGRDFTAADTNTSPHVAIVSESLVRRHYPGENPLGKRLHVSIGPADGMKAEIVGVVGDVKMTTLEGESQPAVFLPHTQLPIGLMTFVIRTDLDPLSLSPSVAKAVQGIDPELPLAEVRAIDDIVAATLARPRTVSTLLTAFAILALILAAVGVYGVMAYSVSQRTQEIGVRMALGATANSVFGMVLGQAMRLVGLGVAVGVVAAAMLTGVLEALLYETPTRDPWTFAATAVVLVIVAALASYVPARRGTRIAPLDALRVE